MDLQGELKEVSEKVEEKAVVQFIRVEPLLFSIKDSVVANSRLTLVRFGGAYIFSKSFVIFAMNSMGNPSF